MLNSAALLLALLLVQDEKQEDKRTTEARAVMQKGFDAIQGAKGKEGDEKKKAYEEAIVHFRTIVKDYKETSVYGICHFNIGAILCDFLEKYEDAIVEFKAIIDSNVDDKDDTGQLMSPYRNYRYHSWRLITTCYEKLKKPAHAVEAVLKSRAAYISDCGTCQESMMKETGARLSGLVKSLAPQSSGEDLAEALKDETAPEKVLLKLGKKMASASKADDARALLKAIATEFPTRDAAKEAEKLLKEMK
jgi:tetratricopeptide (TPR) repeat protein